MHVAKRTRHVPPVILSAIPPISAWSPTGYVMGITIAVITVMRISFIVRIVSAHLAASDALTTGVSQQHGIVMVTMTVVIIVMSHQSIVNLNRGHVSGTSSLVIMGTVFQGSTFVMGIMIVWITLMRIPDINAVSRNT